MTSSPSTGSPSAVTPERLGSLFRPSRIALVGASDKSNFSRSAFTNLVDFGFGDRVHLVNRRGVEVHGRPSVTSCGAIGEEVDVAFLMVPQAGTLDAMSDAAAAGIRNAVVLSSGYGEVGDAGRAAQDELVAHARRLDMALLGPNHLGFANLVHQVPVTPIPGLPRTAGPVALLSQSGASSSAMVDFATAAGVGLSYMVTLGNEAMITAGHVLDFLVDDESTRAVAIFLEAIRDPEVFRRAARRAAKAGKAVVVLKAGSSELSARTAAAHTGALVGDDRVIDAVLRREGVIRVDSIEDMLITAGLAAHTGPIDRAGLGVVSISGGACDILADRAEDLGLPLPAFAPETEKALDAVMPDYGTVHNPLDVTGAAIIDPTLFTSAITTVADDPEIGIVGVINSLPGVGEGSYTGQVFADAIGRGIASASTPAVYINQVMLPVTDHTRAVMDHADVAYVLPGLRGAAVALRNLGWWSGTIRENARERVGDDHEVAVPAPERRHGAWSEHSARQMLADAGVPVVPAHLVADADAAVTAAAELGGPVALKIVSPDILHKSDIGGVRLGVVGEDAVRAAHEAVTAVAASVPGAHVEGVLVSPMRTGGVEILVGVVRDPQWGPMLAVALGGIFVEVLQDSALSPVPVTPDRARAMIDGLRGSALLRGARGSTPADLDALAAVVARVSDLAEALGDDLESLEVNPLRVDGATVEALDALVTWKTA
ncbi:acetate--CoA ligase family protein [Pseudonocardia sp. KRD291]|uniref:acetate--CoA ligase family protein n=1 Tax=Pseudonocardia sp. KRD291 TaxID=2792007 RepID=UPI001C4A6D88|nr:acetate--CoA ligase family protein [Pseudonocardia sp. KRD291]MBW0101047.1 acetate--CoA ligase family protein [Pseudonocardia sp. KRD291]